MELGLHKTSIGVTRTVNIPFDAQYRVHGFSFTSADIERLPEEAIWNLICMGINRDLSARSGKHRKARYDMIMQGLATSARDRKEARQNMAKERMAKTIATEQILQMCIKEGMRRPKPAEIKKAVEAMLSGPAGPDIYAEAIDRIGAARSATLAAREAVRFATGELTKEAFAAQPKGAAPPPPAREMTKDEMSAALRQRDDETTKQYVDRVATFAPEIAAQLRVINAKAIEGGW